MARARNIKPGFFKNDQLAECDPLARLLFAGLWCLADRQGRVEYRPKRIKAEILPYDNCNLEELVLQLIKTGCLRGYSKGGLLLLDIPAFSIHQNPHKNEPESELPEWSQDVDGIGFTKTASKNSRKIASPPVITRGLEKLREDSASAPADSLILNPDSLILNPYIASSPEIPAQKPAPPMRVVEVFEVFDTVGPEPSWRLESPFLETLQRAFPAVDVRQEVLKASAWLQANPANRKTARGMPKFLNGWMSRANDRGSNGQNQRAGPSNGGPRLSNWQANVNLAHETFARELEEAKAAEAAKKKNGSTK